MNLTRFDIEIPGRIPPSWNGGATGGTMVDGLEGLSLLGLAILGVGLVVRSKGLFVTQISLQDEIRFKGVPGRKIKRTESWKEGEGFLSKFLTS